MSVVRWADKARDELADIYVQATPQERQLIETLVLAFERRSCRESVASRRIAGWPIAIRSAPAGRILVQRRAIRSFSADRPCDETAIQVGDRLCCSRRSLK